MDRNIKNRLRDNDEETTFGTIYSGSSSTILGLATYLDASVYHPRRVRTADSGRKKSDRHALRELRTQLTSGAFQGRGPTFSPSLSQRDFGNLGWKSDGLGTD